MNTSFYSRQELKEIGFKKIGDEVCISRKSSIYKPESISFGNNVRVDDFCILSGGLGLEFGSYIHLSAYSALYGGSRIILKDYSTLSGRVTVYSESDDFSGYSMTNPCIPDLYKPKYIKGSVIIEKYVIIGVNSTILPGIVLAEGTAVGAHSLVTKDCDAWSIYFGVPAKKYKMRNQNILELEQNFRNRT